MKTSMETVNQAMPIPGMDAMADLFTVMRQKLQEKLDHLYQFNQTSSNNYSTAIQLAASIATGLAEVQSGKGFSPASGTFSTQGLNMEWTASIQKITEDRAHQSETLEGDNLVESETVDYTSSSEENGDDLKKAARDLTGELSGEYDVRCVIEGVDPDTGEKLSWWKRGGQVSWFLQALHPLVKESLMVYEQQSVIEI